MASISSLPGVTLPTVRTVGGSALAYSRTTEQAGSTSSALATSRPASSGGPGVFSVSISDAGGSRSELTSALRGKLEDILGVFHKDRAERDSAVEDALAGLSGLIDKSLSDPTADALQIRLSGLTSAYGVVEGEQQIVDGRITEFAIEVGLARGGSVRSEDIGLVGLDGKALELTKPELASGVSSGRFERFVLNKGDALGGPEVPADLQRALEQMKKTQDILSSYRNGDSEPLDRLLRGEFADLFGSSFSIDT